MRAREMPTARDGNIVKIAVEMDSTHAGNYVPQLIEFDQNRSLLLIIQDLCAVWSISDCEQYSLQFNDSTNAYITEKNRNEIKNGSVLRLTFSPSRTAQDILDKLQFDEFGDTRRLSFRRLVKLSTDYTFALEFINKQGLQFLIDSTEKDAISINDGLGFALESFVELMDHGIISWDNLEPKFIGKIANHVNFSNSSHCDSKVLVNSLAILESIVISSTKFNVLVEAEVTLPNLIILVQQNITNPEIQQNSIALINALFAKSDLSKRKAMAATLSSKRIRNVILTQVLNPRISSGESSSSTFNVGSEMAHQLYVLQTLLFNLHEERMNTILNTSNEMEVKERVLELRKIAFESELERNHSGKSLVSSSFSNSGKGDGFQDDYKRLGFTNCKNPSEDFAEPPGMLALDLLVYFARNYTETYVKFVLENCSRSDREHECPLVKSTIQLTKLLCEILKVNEAPSDEGKFFYPMFFTHDHPLEEFYCIAVSLLNKTWKEMRATVEDFVKVFSVLKTQLTKAMSDSEATVNFDKLKLKLASLTWSVITSLWQKERSSREEWENKAFAILELRDMVKTEIIDLIKQQRLLYLTEGTRFDKYSNKGQRIKDKFWYCRLSTNQKFLCYGDCDENKVLSVDEMPHKFAIIDIKQLMVGKDCPHMKDIKSKKSTFSLAFSLIPDAEQESPLNFVAQNEKIFDYWIDGINALLGLEMTSKEMNNDLETLLSMDIKLRLLDTEGVTIPEKPPEIPASPPNYDFNFKY